MIASTDFSDLLTMDREELDGLTLIHSEFRSSVPLKMTYENICVHEFQTDMNDLRVSSSVVDTPAFLRNPATAPQSSPLRGDESKISTDLLASQRSSGFSSNANPRPVFMAATDFAHEQIVSAIQSFNPDIVEKVGNTDWIIHNRFLSMTICLHSYTEYDQGDFVFEDVATHRVVISIVAEFNTKFIYQSDEDNSVAFGSVNQFYTNLLNKINE